MIVLFTDFGLEGPYTGQVEAVLHQQAPGIPVINLFSDLTPFDIQSAAYLLPAYAAFFPPGTVFICVVDPGVGGERPGVVVCADGRWFVGPDEGLFTLLVRRADKVEWWRLPEPENVASSFSCTFHGRDVFAPVAARLARDGRAIGEPVSGSVNDYADWPDDGYKIVYIDRYGNAITGVRASEISSDAVLSINGHELKHAETFSSVPEGVAFWYGNSNGLVELAVNRGRADEVLGIKGGSSFSV